MSSPAKYWHAHQDNDSLLRGRRLREAQRWYKSNRGAASELEKAFLEASVNAEATRSWRLKSVIVLLVILLVISLAGVSFAALQWSRAANLGKKLQEEQSQVKLQNAELAQQQQQLIEKNNELENQKNQLHAAREVAERDRKLAQANQKIAEEKTQLALRQKEQILNQRKEVDQAREQVKEASKRLPDNFIKTANEYARRINLPGADPTIFFLRMDNESLQAVWNTDKRQYEVNTEHINARGLAEYVAIEGRFMAKHFDKCFGNPRDPSRMPEGFDFWNGFRYSLTFFILLTEPQLSGEGQGYFGDRNYLLLERMKKIQSALQGDAQPVRALSLALLDKYECDWTERNLLDNVLRVNRELGRIPENVIRDAFALRPAAGL